MLWKVREIMSNLYTIGFTKKSAEEFFNLLKENNIEWIIDIRLNPNSQLSGFAKGKDLSYFLKELVGVKYKHIVELAPTKEILDDYRKKVIDWKGYEERFIKLLKDRKIGEKLDDLLPKKVQNICLLCSEASPKQCHRRLVGEYIKEFKEGIVITHLE